MKTSYSFATLLEFRRATWRDRRPPRNRRSRIWQRVVDWLTEPIAYPGKIVDGMVPLQKEYNEEEGEVPKLAPEPVPQLDEPRASQS